MSRNHHKPRTSQQKSWRRRLTLWGGLVVLLFSIGLVIGHFRTQEEPQPSPVADGTSSQPTREVLLYFASNDGKSLVAETRAITECQVEVDCLREMVLALIAGPQGDLVPILPEQVALRDLVVDGSLVSLDFSHELIAAHPGGTQSELLTTYGLVDTLAVNFPHLRRLQILVEGTVAATLKGHVDLRQPISPDFSLVEEGLAPAGKMTSLPAGGDE